MVVGSNPTRGKWQNVFLYTKHSSNETDSIFKVRGQSKFNLTLNVRFKDKDIYFLCKIFQKKVSRIKIFISFVKYDIAFSRTSLLQFCTG